MSTAAGDIPFYYNLLH